MNSKSKWPTVLIVLLTVGLVFGPVLLPREVSRWHLAAAHLAFRNNDDATAEKHLQQALRWDPSLEQDGDFWIAQLPRQQQNIDQTLDIIEKAVQADPRWAGKAAEASLVLAEGLDFQRAVRALKIAYQGRRPTTPEGLNQLAYYRSLAGIELDEALKDIDKAISQAGKLATLLDTKAWVLHAMNRHVEALAFINDAIEQMEKEFAAAGHKLPEPLTADAVEPALSPAPDSPGAQAWNWSDIFGGKSAASGQPQVTTDDDSLLHPPGALEQSLLPGEEGNVEGLAPTLKQTLAELALVKKRLGLDGYNAAVMRFHRLRIVEALGLSSQADKDRQWLVQRGVPVVDELF